MDRIKAKHLLGFAFATVLLLGATAWAKNYTFQSTPIAPGATGKIEAKADKSAGNTSVTIHVDNLARPTLLTPPANAYVVWIEPQGGTPQNQGVLTVGGNEKGDLKMTTSASKFKVLVTAEADTHPQAPSDRVVLQSEVEE